MAGDLNLATTSPEPLPPLSPLGLGAWAFGGVGWGPQDDEDSVATILHAVDRGVGWIDTAAVYGGGHAEEIVGRALAKIPVAERPLVFTKAGIRIDPDTGGTDRDLGPDSIRAECEASLRRLGVERLDLYQLHWPVDEDEVVEAAWSTLGGRQQLRPPALRALRGDPAARRRPAAALAAGRKAGAERVAVAGGARRADHRLQPARVGAPLRPLLGRAARHPARGRLAAPTPPLPEPTAGAGAGAGRAAATARGRARHLDRRAGDRLGAPLRRRRRRYRRRPLAGAGRRLDRRRRARARPGRGRVHRHGEG